MSKYVIDKTTLTAIGDAVRGKSGTSDLIPVSGLADAITNLPSGGGGEVEPIVLSDNQSYGCAGSISSAFIKNNPNKVSTDRITNANYMFYNYANESIPFEINVSGTSCEMNHFFDGCKKLKTLPKINFVADSAHWYNMNHMFHYCEYLRYIPEDYFDNWNWKSSTSTSGYSYNAETMFRYCRSLRSLPLGWLKNMNPKATGGYSYFANGFDSCFVLDELIDLPIPYTADWTSNIFSYTFSSCYRLKNITFAKQEDGSPYSVRWKNQVMDLSKVGYAPLADYITSYNSGITADKEVEDGVSYETLVDANDPDWFTCTDWYSRYNHDSAVNTINSLPDSSGFGTNTIKFKGDAGSATYGGAIRDLTADEIAVAASKGWTVTIV